ncbi:MAG TPA: DUF4199 domain-containing protein [Chitinophagales bacterium]|nr:DUF4199 domain-containing protein [Chitinophagales bacterium]
MNRRTDVSPVALGAKLGLYAGLTCAVFYLILYAIKPALLISPAILLGFAIVVVFKIAAAYYSWKSQEGRVTFQSALQSIFLVSAVSLLIVFFFFYLVFNVIDLSLVEQIKKNITDNLMKSFQAGKLSKSQLDESLLKVMEFKLGAGAFFALYSFSLFVGFFYALVFSGITRLISREISLSSSHSNN